jgi:hypothetical protein
MVDVEVWIYLSVLFFHALEDVREHAQYLASIEGIQKNISFQGHLSLMYFHDR